MKKAVLIGGAVLTSVVLSAGAVVAMGGKSGGMMGHGFAGMGGHRQMEMPAFGDLDANGDGQISVDEVKAHHASRIAEIDTNGDGLISADEMTAHMMSQMQDRMGAMAENMIRWRDSDGDGQLSAEELGGMQGMERMFMHLDENGDGTISAEEFDAIGKMGNGRGMRGHGKRGGQMGGHDGGGMKGMHSFGGN